MTRRMGHPIRHYMEAALGIVSSIWLGLLIGVSFIATPVKFSAPTLALEPALDVGRVTFDLFSKVEWGVATLLLLTVVLAGFRPWRTAAAGVLVAALGIQAIWLLPALDARVAAVMAGTPLPPSWHHAAYGGLEVIKSVTLLALALVEARHVYRKHRSPESRDTGVVG